MKFDELDKKMRVFETSLDQCVIPGIYIVARLDGRGFTKLTKEQMNFERPFDIRFRDAMIQTVEYLMNTGFRIIYGYTESDEISLLFHLEENSFGRKTRKINTILAGEGSAMFTSIIGQVAAFDCRICPMPNESLVVDYFRWRNEDAHRNSLNAYCYWKMRDQGKTKLEATKALEGMSVSAKNELLFQMGINFNDLPVWQKRGIGFYYEEVVKEALNLKTNETIEATRRKIKCDLNLPMGDAYGKLISTILQESLEK
jgi:tRNA(His) guanylyltransferase